MGLVDRDFLMRLVKQLAEVIARAMKLKLAKKNEEAAEVIEAGCLTLLGIDWQTLAWVDSKSAAQLLKEPARIHAFATLLEHHGLVSEDPSKFRHALEMYREAGNDSGAVARLEALLNA